MMIKILEANIFCLRGLPSFPVMRRSVRCLPLNYDLAELERDLDTLESLG